MSTRKTGAIAIGVTAFLASALPAAAAEGLTGATMSLWWALPFAGILLSIATGPLLYPHVWEHHYGKITAAWTALLVLPMVATFGVHASLEAVLHTLLLEYIPFIILLFALFTIAGGHPGHAATSTARLLTNTGPAGDRHAAGHPSSAPPAPR